MSTTVTAINQQLIDINAIGVQKIQQGDFIGALNHLNRGLTMLLTTETEAKAAGVPTGSVGTNLGLYHYGHAIVKSTPLLTRDGAPLPPLKEHEDVFCLYNRALEIDADAATLANSYQFGRHIVISVFLFNIGLIYHLVGLYKGTSAFVEKALEFYSMSFESAETTPSERCCVTGPTVKQFCLLAILNNIGHIHSYFGRLDETAIVRDELAHNLSAFAPLFAQELRDEFRIMFLNAVFFSKDSLAGAPAA